MKQTAAFLPRALDPTLTIAPSVDDQSENRKWTSPPHNVSLGPKEVHVWASILSNYRSVLQSFEQLLSSDERAQGERFHRRDDREKFMISHGLLRLILALYTNTTPEMLSFVNLSGGKPSVDCRKKPIPLAFSLSHSEDVALIAISGEVELGIDVEYIRDDFEFEPVLESVAGQSGRTYLRSLAASDRPGAFHRIWTRLEAICKAQGRGLDVGLKTNIAESALSARAISKSSYTKHGFTIFDLPPIAGYAASLAIRGANYNVHFWQSPADIL